ncbi:MAG: 3-phosphoserine/phosphohydroxythreonine transaminase [Hyphomicrobiaceae bacterium]|nr:3-phosphoserine/phosphohydroxythreonine transaminase [Hyphomicrobiaceae bacterium]
MTCYSFASGPAPLPPDVIEAVAADVRRLSGSSYSLLELPFTNPLFSRILEEAEDDIRYLLALPDTYHVLFLQGGATAQFSLIPQNLCNGVAEVDYVDTGLWSHRAIEAALPWCQVNIAARGDGRTLPCPASWLRSPNAAYCHFTTNETADGLQYHQWPADDGPPLVADMTADLFTRPFPIDRLGLVYASGQKNLGATGLTLILIRQDLAERSSVTTPSPFDYSRQVQSRSKVNTPPTLAIAIAAHMLKWIKVHGGLAEMEANARRRSDLVYAAIDTSGFYSRTVAAFDRSMLNVCFRTPTARLDELFLIQAAEQGLLDLCGHIDIGGLRASLYNSARMGAAEALVEFMKHFQAKWG